MAAILTFAAGPAAASAKRDLAVSYYEKRVGDMSAAGLTVNFIFKVANSSSSAWYLTGYDYRVVVDNTPYIALQKDLAEPIALQASGSTLIALPVKVTNANLFRAVPSAAGKDRLSCYLIGGMTFSEEPAPGGSRLAVACSGDFPVYRDIVLLPRPLEVKDVTIGGGEMSFKIAVRNPNRFGLEVDQLRYELELGGVAVSRGLLASGLALPAESEREFSVPLLLDFFELGQSLYAALRNPEADFKFSGTIDFKSEWGRFVMPLERAGRVPVAGAR